MSKENIASLFGGLFGARQSEKAKEDYQRAVEAAARWLAEAEGLTLSEYLQREAEAKKGWIN